MNRELELIRELDEEFVAVAVAVAV